MEAVQLPALYLSGNRVVRPFCNSAGRKSAKQGLHLLQPFPLRFQKG